MSLAALRLACGEKSGKEFGPTHGVSIVRKGRVDFGGAGVRAFAATLAAALFSQLLIPLSQELQLGRRKLLNIQQRQMRAFGGADQFIKFELHRVTVTSLSVLNHKDHEKSDDRGGRVDHQLPAVTEAEDGSADQPREHN